MEWRCECCNCKSVYFDSQLSEEEFEKRICPYCGGELECSPALEAYFDLDFDEGLEELEEEG